MEKNNKDIWFPAKKYGYGWGLPVAWQGWVVLVAYFVLMILGYFWLLGSPERIAEYLALVFLLSVALIWICAKKGEKPKWRWGKKIQ